MGGVAGIVLGAGSSTRLRQPKQLLMLGGRTVLAHVVAGAEASSLDRVVVASVAAGPTRWWRPSFQPAR